MIGKTLRTVYLLRKLHFIGYGFVVDATTIKVNMDDIHYSSIAKVPSDLIPVNIKSITAEYAIKNTHMLIPLTKLCFQS